MQSPLLEAATAEDVKTLFRMMLGREPTDAHVQSFLDRQSSIQDVMNVLLSSSEIIRFLSTRHPDHAALALPANARDIQSIYLAMLQRDPEPESLASLIEKQSTVLDIVGIIMLSDELEGSFAARAEAKGDHDRMAQAASAPQIDLSALEATLGAAGDAPSRILVRETELTRPDDPRAARALEVLNESKAFNTTGAAWSPATLGAHLDREGYLLCLDVEDRYSDHGLAGVLAIEGGEIVQFALTAAVLAKGVEQAGLATAQARIAAHGFTRVSGRVVETGRNALGTSVFRGCGFSAAGEGRWEIDAAAAIPLPRHLRLVHAPQAQDGAVPPGEVTRTGIHHPPA